MNVIQFAERVRNLFVEDNREELTAGGEERVAYASTFLQREFRAFFEGETDAYRAIRDGIAWGSISERVGARMLADEYSNTWKTIHGAKQ